MPRDVFIKNITGYYITRYQYIIVSILFIHDDGWYFKILDIFEEDGATKSRTLFTSSNKHSNFYDVCVEAHDYLKKLNPKYDERS